MTTQENTQPQNRGFQKIEIIPPQKLTICAQTETEKKEQRKYLDKEIIDSIIQNIEPGQDRMLISFLWMSGVYN